MNQHMMMIDVLLLRIFPFFASLKERTVRETEMQTIQRKVRRFTEIRPGKKKSVELMWRFSD